MSLYESLLVGLILSSLIGYVAYRRGSLTRSGVLGAILTGTAIFGFGGFIPGLMLVAFFVSSSALSHYKSATKEQFADTFEKGSQRDLFQALSNGGWTAILALAYGLVYLGGANPRTEQLLLAGMLGALATVTADTWATEIGVLSTSAPRMITSGRVVPAGSSGAITRLGTLTAFVGGAFIGVILLVGAVVLYALNSIPSLAVPLDLAAVSILVEPFAGFLVVFIAGLSGLAGCLFDSLLGATVQAVYFCEYDEVQTEQKIHSCGRATRLVHGRRWLDNDLVNFVASIVGSLVAILLVSLLF